jgi:glutamine amidotransferase-like uncharacterized protein
MIRIAILLFVFCSCSLADTIGIYKHAPIADPECVDALVNVLMTDNKIVILNHKTLTSEKLKSVDVLVFPGGLEDSDNFDKMLSDKKKIVRDYVYHGGKYIGICMGAYLAGEHYFNILGDTEVIQYIKRPKSEVKTEYATVVDVFWLTQKEKMYFYDGPAFIGGKLTHDVLACYTNGDAAVIIKKFGKGVVLGIGPHLESQKDWYEEKNLKNYWHKGQHHDILRNVIQYIR